MKILLTAINAKYIHSNPALYSLKAYAAEYAAQIELAEFTINHQLDDILMELYRRKPDVLCFSCYIWNIKYIEELCFELKKVAPEIQLWVGGPEVSYQTEEFLLRNNAISGAMVLEGEETFLELCRYYLEGSIRLSAVKGIVYQEEAGSIIRNEIRKPLDMDQLPFYYQELHAFEHRIIYYETSRGCPFSCTYCLSSIERALRFRSLSLVKKEIKFFLDNRVVQVKFVDRTFNCNHEHAMEIWRFIKENDNGITNFHFEVAADLFTEDEIVLLSGMRKGLVQFEIGVQSVNRRTLKEVRRTMDLERLTNAVGKIAKAANIHQHLDLIAGLPYEDYQSFQHSFDQIYRMQPEQLQLGFLKVLKGSYIYEHRQEYGMRFHRNPPYEILATKWISYDEIIKTKMVEEMLEIYYNSGQLPVTIRLLAMAFQSPFQMFLDLYKYYECNHLADKKHSRITRGEILLAFAADRDEQHIELYREAFIYDLYARERFKKRPDWAMDLSPYRGQMKRYTKGKNVHLEAFYFDFMNNGKAVPAYPVKRKEPELLLFLYDANNKIDKMIEITEGLSWE